MRDNTLPGSRVRVGGSGPQVHPHANLRLSIAVAACLACLVHSACASSAHLSGVQFRIIAEDSGEPLRTHNLDIYRFVYDVQFDSKEAPWYITSATTDDNGIFCLDLSGMDATYTVIQPGEPYGIVRFERASDLRHTTSADHVRVVRFEAGDTHVESNAIYDVKRQVVRIIPTSGDAWEEPYTEILLVAQGFKPSTSRK
jgi:hypothetical protein